MVTYRIDKLNTHLRGQGDVGWATSDAMLPIKHKMLCLFLPHHPNSPFPPSPQTSSSPASPDPDQSEPGAAIFASPVSR